jgi:glyoxylase-like metal-dependent hydrolase (beta-lactamase superfamily II)
VQTVKLIKILLGLVGIAVLLVAIAGLVLFSGLQGDAAGPSLGPGITHVPGFSAVYLLDAGNGQFALIDAGGDKKGVALLSLLQAHHATPDNVSAIFITHAHPDHVGALALFPKAAIYAMKREVPIAAGQEPFGGPVFGLFGVRKSLPFTVNHSLDYGETVTVGDLRVTAFAVPGHTEGSGAYLVNGVLYTGDALQIKTNQQIIGPSAVFSTNRAQGEASLKHLGQELQPRADEVKFIATSHTGTVAGLQPLRAFGGS